MAELEQEQQIAPISVELIDAELSHVYASSKKAEARQHFFQYDMHRDLIGISSSFSGFT